jgi:hypothetical protein
MGFWEQMPPKVFSALVGGLLGRLRRGRFTLAFLML